MGKKQALGSTPTFENVSKATMKNDLFTEEEIEEAKNKPIEELLEEPTEKSPLETVIEKTNEGINEAVEDIKKKDKEEVDLYNNPILRKRIEERQLEKIKNFKPLDPKEEAKKFREIAERKAKQIEAEERARKKDEEKETVKKVMETPIAKPTNKQRLANGYIRATFEINEEHLETIKALALYQNIKQKDLLEALLEKGLENISQEVKEQAKAYYKNSKEPKKDNKAVKDLFI